MKNKIYIYSINDPETNIIKYIGQTNNPKRRFNQHLHNCNLKRTNRKSLWLKQLRSENKTPIFNILYEVNSRSEANELEKELIFKYKSTVLNSTIGGTGVNGCIFSDETKNKLSVKLIERWKISPLRVCSGEDHYLYGKAMSKTTKEKIRDKSKKIKCINLETYEIFDSLMDVVRLYKLRIGELTETCSGKHCSLQGLFFSYLPDNVTNIESFCKEELVKRKKRKKYINNWKPIICMNDGKIFDSIKNASIYYNIDSSCISAVVNGRRNTIHNLKFKALKSMETVQEKKDEVGTLSTDELLQALKTASK